MLNEKYNIKYGFSSNQNSIICLILLFIKMYLIANEIKLVN